jgi:hypothetical protein
MVDTDPLLCNGSAAIGRSFRFTSYVDLNGGLASAVFPRYSLQAEPG